MIQKCRIRKVKGKVNNFIHTFKYYSFKTIIDHTFKFQEQCDSEQDLLYGDRLPTTRPTAGKEVPCVKHFTSPTLQCSSALKGITRGGAGAAAGGGTTAAVTATTGEGAGAATGDGMGGS